MFKVIREYNSLNATHNINNVIYTLRHVQTRTTHSSFFKLAYIRENYSKQQPHSFEEKTNTEKFTIDHSFFVSNDWDPYTFLNLHHNSTTTLYGI